MKLLSILFLFMVAEGYGQQLPVKGTYSKEKSEFVRKYIEPVRIVWQTSNSEGRIENLEQLLKKGDGQANLSASPLCTLVSNAEGKPGFLLDFGKEVHGGLQIVTGRWKDKKNIKIRLRFGESVGEAMSEIGQKGATNDHAMRDFTTELPWLGKLETGTTGFRFVRIDLLDENLNENVTLELKEVRAISVYRDIPYVGSFRSNDTLLNKIWDTGAYTVHLNMQEYLWDGIKRDRLVWVGDLHPEIAALTAVFGYNEVVPKSLDLIRDITPLPKWMNGISAYSMWWIIIQHDWYMHHGDLNYLRQQHSYLKELLQLIVSKVDEKGMERLNGERFLDWPSSGDKKAVHAGLQAMVLRSLSVGAKLAVMLDDDDLKQLCNAGLKNLTNYVPNYNNSKQAAALMAISGLLPPDKANKEVIAAGGVKNFSTFYGYYMLQAKALAGDYSGALNNIREYWGGMLKLGATTFWEDFNIDWTENAASIDQLVPQGKKDIHGDFGDYCYKGYRHSLCHGWASGPTAWLTEHVLGIKVTAPGCREISIKPNLADLKVVEGTFPTPYGVLWVKHVKQANGRIVTELKVPKGIKIVK